MPRCPDAPMPRCPDAPMPPMIRSEESWPFGGPDATGVHVPGAAAFDERIHRLRETRVDAETKERMCAVRNDDETAVREERHAAFGVGEGRGGIVLAGQDERRRVECGRKGVRQAGTARPGGAGPPLLPDAVVAEARAGCRGAKVLVGDEREIFGARD